MTDNNFHKLALSESFERVAKVAEERAAFNAGIEAAAKALEADAKKCDCFARYERECACGAWDDYKSITSARAVEIVRALVTEPCQRQAPMPVAHQAGRRRQRLFRDRQQERWPFRFLTQLHRALGRLRLLRCFRCYL